MGTLQGNTEKTIYNMVEESSARPITSVWLRSLQCKANMILNIIIVTTGYVLHVSDENGFFQCNLKSTMTSKSTRLQAVLSQSCHM